MIEVYNKSNKNFDFNGDMILKPSLCDLQVELNGIIEVTLEHPYDKEGRWKYIKEDNIIRVPYPGKKEGQLFFIYDKDKGMTGITCKARHIFFDLIGEILVDCRPTNSNGQEALNKILFGTGFIGHSNIVSINTAHYIRKHIANEALISDDENSFINKWGGELDVDNFNVYMNDRTGGDYGVTFKYGKDLIDLNENSNIDSLVTRILPVGFNGITIPETYIDSPLIYNYRKIKADVIKFDYIKVKEDPSDEEGYDTLEEAQNALREACKEKFNEGIDKVLLQLELEVAKLENTLKYKDFKEILTTGLGDTVGVEHLDIGINIKTRIIKFTYDCIKEKYKSITIGNYIENIIDKQNNIETTLDKITNADGTVNAIEVAGVLNAIKVKMRAMKDIAQKQDIRALLCEDLDPESPTYGAMCYGTMGFMIAEERTTDNRDWEWRTFGTGKGFYADLIVAGSMLADRIKAGMLKSINELTWINMDDGTFNFANKLKFDGVNWDIDLTGKDLATNTDVKALINVNSNSILAQVSNSNKLISKNAILNGDFTSSTGSSSYQNWNKNTIGAIASTYSVDGTNWCNFYTSTLAGELFAYQDITVDVGKTYEFYCKVAKYASTKQYYCIRIQEYISDVWTTKKEFTGTVDVDRSNPLVLYTKYKPTVDKVRIWIGKTDGNKFDIYATDFQMFYTADVVKSSELKILNDKIESKVSSSDVGTIVEQNAYAVKIAWNKISNYVQFENGGLSIYNGSLTESQKRAVFNERGSHFWRDGYYLGKIGTNQYVNDNSIKGIVFDLEPDGGYMSWSVMKNASDVSYTMMWTYANKTVGGYTAGQLHAGCDIDMHNYYFRNYNFEGGGITGTLVFSQIVEMASNGTAARWFNNSKLVFKKGVLIDATWGNV